MAVASPSKFSKRKLARLFEHELAHIEGADHDEMTKEVYWSKGGEPAWARGKRIRHVKKGRSEIP